MVTGSWELLGLADDLKTPAARGRQGRGRVHEVRTSESCALVTASAHLGSHHLAAFPNYLTPGPVDYTFHLLPALQQDTFRKKLDRLFGTFQGTSRSADSCWEQHPLASQCTRRSALPTQRARGLEEKEDRPPRPLTDNWM